MDGLDTAPVVLAAARCDSGGGLDQEKIDLTWRVKVTSGSRFNASKRLSSRDAKINLLNAVASVAVIFLSVVSASVKTGEILGIILALITILASIVILVTSLFQYALKDAVTAERMHICGLKLSELRYRMVYSEVTSREQLISFMNDYNGILSQYSNHDESDYQRYRDEHPDEFANRPDRGTGPGGTRTQKAFSWALSIIIGALSIATAIVTSFALIK